MPEPVMTKRITERSLRDILFVLFRHKWKVIFFFLAVIMIVIFGTFLTPAIYQSEAKLLVRLGRESVTLDPTANTGRIISVTQTRESEINSELEILKSWELAEKVVEAIGPTTFLEPFDGGVKSNTFSNENSRGIFREIKLKTYSAFKKVLGALNHFNLRSRVNDRQKAIFMVTKGLDIKTLKNSNIISISYESESPKLAKEVVTKFIDLYLDKHIAMHRATGSFEFFNQQTKELLAMLVHTEKALEDLKNKIGITSMNEHRRIILDRLGVLRKEVEETNAAMVASRAKVQAMRGMLAKLPETMVMEETSGFPNAAADQMRQKLYELQLKEQDLLSKYNENTPPVIEIRRQIAEARALLNHEEPTRTQVKKGINTEYQQIRLSLLSEESNLRSLQAKISALREQLTHTQNEIKTLNEGELRIGQLEREISIQEANYRKYQENREQARINHALETEKISNISLVQAATYPIKPVRPKPLLNLILGFVLGILGGVLLAFCSEYLDHTIGTPEALEEKLKLPALAAIPHSEEMQHLGARR